MDQYSGDDIRLIRVAHKGLRQIDVARAAGLSRQRIGQFERRRRVSSELASRIARAVALAAADR